MDETETPATFTVEPITIAKMAQYAVMDQDGAVVYDNGVPMIHRSRTTAARHRDRIAAKRAADPYA